MGEQLVVDSAVANDQAISTNESKIGDEIKTTNTESSQPPSPSSPKETAPLDDDQTDSTKKQLVVNAAVANNHAISTNESILADKSSVPTFNNSSSNVSVATTNSTEDEESIKFPDAPTATKSKVKKKSLLSKMASKTIIRRNRTS